MDIQRTLLIGATVLLSFMLLTEWTNFRAEREQAQAPENRLTGPIPQDFEPTSDAIEAPTTEALDLPSAPLQVSNAIAGDETYTATGQGDTDIPTVTDPASESETPAPALSDTNIIQVYSDTLQLAISLRGGDIVEVALPKFLARKEDPNTPFILLENNEQRTYIAQSGLIGRDGIDAQSRALYTSAQRRYDMGDQDRLSVDLQYTNTNGLSVTKRFSFERDSYVVNVAYLVQNGTSQRWQANLFGQIKRDSTAAPQSDNSGMGMQPFLGAATTTPDDRFEKFSFEDMAEQPFAEKLDGGWIAMIQHYFLSAWIPAPEQTHNYSTRVTRDNFNIAGFTSPALVLDPGANGDVSARFYAGPKDQYSLQEISPFLELSVDYGWLWWVAQPLFWLLTKIHSLVGNWGASIILLTVFIKAVFFKLSATSYRSMANMRRVQPKMQGHPRTACR